MSKSWIILDSNGQKVGPLQAKQIQNCLKQGLFLPTDVAQEVGSGNVASIIDIPDIFQSLSQGKRPVVKPSQKTGQTKKKVRSKSSPNELDNTEILLIEKFLRIWAPRP